MLNEEKSTVTPVTFPVDRMHAIAAGSAAACVALSIAVHLCTPFLWSGYQGASYKTKLAWCNRIVSAVHVSKSAQCKCMKSGLMYVEVDCLDWSTARPS